MRVRTLAAPTLAAALALAASACFKSETPTGPSLPASNSGVVHVVGQNVSGGALGLTRWATGEPLGPVEVAPGGTVEMMRWNTRVQGTMFIVFAPIAEQPHFKAVAQVEYNVLSVPASKTDEISPVVRVARDPSGAVLATTDRPDVIEIGRVTPM
jgi:hypothetical protein